MALSYGEQPEQIGPYHIRQVIGEGGMGIVFEAEQKSPIRRLVAVKMLKPGLTSTEVLGRFEGERQALAVMDHPGIAKVFDAGMTEQGLPYFAMELVRGVRIDRYADHERLNTRQRVELFAEICDAVQHAHQKGLIHRDLKPSNLIVTESGGARIGKVIDFGVAKATGLRLTEHTVVTTFGQAIGTLAYMSPEQAESSGLDVDTRADIYSLGVVLHELLSGRVPLDPKDVGAPAFLAKLIQRDFSMPTMSSQLELLREVPLQSLATSRATDPKDLRREMRGDLQWIVQKAIEKDRNRRYETANGLAMDLRRYLRGEPVVARPPTPMYRAAKFVRRNRASVTAAALVLMTAVGGAVAASIGMLRAREAEALAVQEARTASTVTDFLVGLFQENDPGESEGEAMTVRQLLDIGAATADTVLRDEPLVRGRMLATMGRIYGTIGLYEESVAMLDRALGVYRRHDVPPADLARALYLLGHTHRERGDFGGAEAAYREALEIREQTLAPDHPDVASALSNLGATLIEVGRYEEAEPLMLRAHEIRESVLAADDPSLPQSHNDLGALYLMTGRFEDAVDHLERGLNMRGALLGEHNPDLGTSYMNLGVAHWFRADYHAAEAAYERARIIFEASLPPGHPRLGSIYNNLAETSWITGRYAEAERLFRRALDIKRAALEANHPSLSVSQFGLANVLRDQGKYREAASFYEAALAIRSSVYGPEHEQLLEVLTEYAESLRLEGRGNDAARMEARAAAITSAVSR